MYNVKINGKNYTLPNKNGQYNLNEVERILGLEISNTNTLLDEYSIVKFLCKLDINFEKSVYESFMKASEGEIENFPSILEDDYINLLDTSMLKLKISCNLKNVNFDQLMENITEGVYKRGMTSLELYRSLYQSSQKPYIHSTLDLYCNGVINGLPKNTLYKLALAKI